MRKLLAVLIVAGLLVAVYLIYQRYSSGDLNVDPHARGEIEKAKRR